MDTKQPYWQLAAIQVAANGLPVLHVGRQLSLRYGFQGLLTSTVAGALILWVIGLAAVAMTQGNRKDAIDNVRTFLGGPAARIIALITLLLFVFWQALQLEQTAQVFLEELGPRFELSPKLAGRIMIAAGIVIVFLAALGIRFIKWFCSLAIPLLAVFLAYLIVVNWDQPFSAGAVDGRWRFPLEGTIQVVALTFAGMVNLPTFFRHSRSMPDSFLALALITIGTSAWILAGAWLPPLGSDTLHLAGFSPYVVFGFALLSLTTVNLVNIYFGCAGWDAFYLRPSKDQPSDWSKERLAAVGLLGVGVFAVVQFPPWTATLEALLLGAIGCLVVTLMSSVIIQLVVHHRPRRAEKTMSSVAWAVGCLAVVLTEFNIVGRSVSSLGAGAVVTALAMLIILFIEETFWCAKSLLGNSGKKPPAIE